MNKILNGTGHKPPSLPPLPTMRRGSPNRSEREIFERVLEDHLLRKTQDERVPDHAALSSVARGKEEESFAVEATIVLLFQGGGRAEFAGWGKAPDANNAARIAIRAAFIIAFGCCPKDAMRRP